MLRLDLAVEERGRIGQILRDDERLPLGVNRVADERRDELIGVGLGKALALRAREGSGRVFPGAIARPGAARVRVACFGAVVFEVGAGRKKRCLEAYGARPCATVPRREDALFFGGRAGSPRGRCLRGPSPREACTRCARRRSVLTTRCGRTGSLAPGSSRTRSPRIRAGWRPRCDARADREGAADAPVEDEPEDRRLNPREACMSPRPRTRDRRCRRLPCP